MKIWHGSVVDLGLLCIDDRDVGSCHNECGMTFLGIKLLGLEDRRSVWEWMGRRTSIILIPEDQCLRLGTRLSIFFSMGKSSQMISLESKDPSTSHSWPRLPLTHPQTPLILRSSKPARYPQSKQPVPYTLYS